MKKKYSGKVVSMGLEEKLILRKFRRKGWRKKNTRKTCVYMGEH